MGGKRASAASEFELNPGLQVLDFVLAGRQPLTIAGTGVDQGGEKKKD